MNVFFVSRFQRTTGRMIALRRPPAKPPNPPRNPTSGRRPSPLKSVCWMDQTTRPQLRCANTLYHTRYEFPPEALSRDGCSMATRADLQPSLPPAESMKGFTCRVCCFDGSCANLCRADRTRQEVHARFTPQMPPVREATIRGRRRRRSLVSDGLWTG